MTSENPTKKRRIVKKLDFENCIVTSVKTKARTKRKLRAKLTREVENLEESPQKEDEYSSSRSPVLSQKTRFLRQTSPVLMRTPIQRPNSPVLLNKRKIDFEMEDTTQTCPKLNTETSSLRKSPVFKVKASKLKSGNATTTTTTIITTPSQKETSQRISGSDTENSYQIDDFTQDSKPNVEISSVESQQNAHSILDWEHCSVDTIAESEISLDDTCPRFVYDSPEGTSDLKDSDRKNFKNRDSLLGRLEKLGRKQASEKLLWHHQKQKKIATSKKLSVISFWNEDSGFILKCRLLSDSPDSNEVSYLFINSQWIPAVKRIQQGSVLRLYSPWQKVSVAGLGADVLLNIICMEILDEEVKMADAAPEKIRFESVPLGEYETDEKHFVESLFPSNASPFLY